MKDNKQIGVGVGIMILKNNQVLLGKRHGDPKKAKSELHGEGKWTMPGGKLHFGEKLKDAAYREVFEETNLKIRKNKLEIITLNDDIVGNIHFVTVGFMCKDFKGDVKVMEPDEITEWKWFNIKNLPRPLYFPSKKILKYFLDTKA